MDVSDADKKSTDIDALLPNGCELMSYVDGSGTSRIRTQCAVIVRNGGQSSSTPNSLAVGFESNVRISGASATSVPAAASTTVTDPLLTHGKNLSNCCRDKTESKQYLHDPISYAVGEFGKWQFQLTLLLALFNFPCTWHIFVLTFQSDNSGEYWCSRPQHLKNLTLSEWTNISGINRISLKGNSEYDPCNIKKLNYDNVSSVDLINNNVDATSKCTAWEFAPRSTGETIVSETAAASICGNDVFTWSGAWWVFLRTRFRQIWTEKTLMTSLMLQIIIGILVAVCPWFEVYLILRAILGFVCVSIVFSGLILCMELVGGKWLTISGVSYMSPVPLGYIIIAGIAFVCHGWRNLQLAITLPSIFLLALWWILPESPRWLLTMGKIDQVMEVLKEAARINKRPLPPNMDKVLKQSISVIDITDKPKGRISDLFRTRTIRLISLVLYIVWFSVYLVYYGLVLNLSKIGGDVYLNSIISGIVEVPAIGLSIIILLKMGRRIPLCLTLVSAGIACFLTLIVPNDDSNNSSSEWLTITLAMIGKFSVSSSNVIMPVFTAELFPTVIRNLGVGSSNIPAGIALMIVPYLWNMASWNYHLPMMMLGITGVIGGFSVLLLPETSNQGLADTLEAIEEDSSIKKQKEVDSVK